MMNLQRREEIRELIAEIARYEELGATLDLESKARDAITELLAHIDTLEQTAAERVIARGAVVKPHTFGELVNQVRDIANQHAGTEQLRERIAYALAPHFERDAGPTPDYTGEGSAWVPPVESGDIDLGEGAWISVSKYKICDHGHRKALWVSAEEVKMKMPGCVEARAVVVPELTEEALVRAGGPYCINDREPFQRGARWAVEFVREHSRAIPADRALGDGMVAVTPEYLDAAWGLDDMSDLEMFMWFRDNQEESGSDAQRVAKIFWREAQEWKKHQRKKFDALRANQGGTAT